MAKVIHIDDRERLLAKLDKLRKEVEKGTLIGLAWAGYTNKGNFKWNWSAIDAPGNFSRGNEHIGGSMLRVALCAMTAEMDHDVMDSEVDNG